MLLRTKTNHYNYYKATSYLKIKWLIKEFLKRMVLILGLRQVLFLKLYLGDVKHGIINKSGWLKELDTFLKIFRSCFSKILYTLIGLDMNFLLKQRSKKL